MLTRLVSAGAGVSRVNKRRTETPCRELLCVVSVTRQSDAGPKCDVGKKREKEKVVWEALDLFSVHVRNKTVNFFAADLIYGVTALYECGMKPAPL